MNDTDEIIDPIRAHRDAHAKSFNYDVKRIVKDLQRQERESGADTIIRPPRKARSAVKDTPG